MSEPPAFDARLAQPDDSLSETFSISELSQAFGVTPRALRFYEDQGLIAPLRQGANRIYTKRDRARLAWIVRAKNVGFSLGDIREMIDLYDLGDGRREQRRVTLLKCRTHVANLERQRRDIDAALAEITAFLPELEAMVASEAAAEDQPG